MIRPITVMTFLMACGSGLYLYTEKHDVQVLDRTIEATVRQTDAYRDQSRVIATEWTTLNAPERLRDYSDKYLTDGLALKSIQPTQFTSLADLDKRLPAVEMPPAPTADDGLTVASTTDSDADAPATPPTEDLPRPPLPVAMPQTAVASVEPSRTVQPDATRSDAPRSDMPVKQEAVASAEPPRALARVGAANLAPAVSQPPLQAMKTSDRRPAAAARAPDVRQAEPKLAEPKLAEPRLAEPRLADARPTEPTWAERQQVVPRPTRPTPNPPLQAAMRPEPYRAPVAAQPMPVSAPYGGSMLGMARSYPSAPRPTPVASGSTWYNAN
jgi:hypothetical protein